MVDDLSRFEGVYDGYTEESLLNLIEENTKAVNEIEFENSIFESYIKRLDITVEHQVEQIVSEVSRSSRNRSRSRNAAAERALRLTAEQKCTIAKVEIENYTQEIAAYKQNSEAILDNYKAIIEEAEIQLKFIEKIKYSYDKHITKRAFQPRYNAIMAERLVRFIEEILKSQVT
uniref:Vps5 domain-containing protein n=1 Tax=Mesocestoides corti TaxID=53468 RepID=A0A5K3F951_MESCO